MKFCSVKTRITFVDVIIIIAVLSAAFAGFIFMNAAESGKACEISCNGNVTRYSLDENRTVSISSNGFSYTVVIENGEVYLSEADCPDKICVKKGRISKSRDAIICVPGELTLSVIGGKDYADIMAS